MHFERIEIQTQSLLYFQMALDLLRKRQKLWWYRKFSSFDCWLTFSWSKYIYLSDSARELFQLTLESDLEDTNSVCLIMTCSFIRAKRWCCRFNAFLYCYHVLTRNNSQMRKNFPTIFSNDHMIINFYTYAKKRLSSKIHEHIGLRKNMPISI